MNATHTQRESYARVKHSGAQLNEQARVFQCLMQADKPLNYHEIMQHTGLPVNHCVRAINNLCHPKAPAVPLADVAFSANAPETGRRVNYYKPVKQ
jgi:hypothetical protein